MVEREAAVKQQASLRRIQAVLNHVIGRDRFIHRVAHPDDALPHGRSFYDARNAILLGMHKVYKYMSLRPFPDSDRHFLKPSINTHSRRQRKVAEVSSLQGGRRLPKRLLPYVHQFPPPIQWQGRGQEYGAT